MFAPLPWTAFPDDQTHFWVHYSLCCIGLLLALVTMATQLVKPAPYGRHGNGGGNWGPMVHQRVAHTLSDAPPGVVFFSLVFFLYGTQRGYVNIVFFTFWLCHYVHRGFIHPWVMKYSSPKTPVGISLAGVFPNLFYSYLNADWLGSANYVGDYYMDPRFILGAALFLLGFCINRYADIKLRMLRPDESSGYAVPKGGPFELVSCPNYFGEMLEWFGWALCTWSAAGLVWFLFGCGTFIPRAMHNHKWYKDRFPDYPQKRRALIPFLY